MGLEEYQQFFDTLLAHVDVVKPPDIDNEALKSLMNAVWQFGCTDDFFKVDHTPYGLSFATFLFEGYCRVVVFDVKALVPAMRQLLSADRFTVSQVFMHT